MLPRTLCAQIRFLQNGNSQLLRLSARSLSAKAEKPVIPTPLPIATPSSLPSSVEEPPKGFTGKIKTIFKKYGCVSRSTLRVPHAKPREILSASCRYIAIALYSGAYLTQFGVATGIFMEV